MALFWLRRQWLDVVSGWRKAPVCFSLGVLSVAGLFLSVAFFFCCGSRVLFYAFIPVVEYFHPGIDAPDNWALGITYWLYLMMAQTWAVIVFLAAGLWRARAKTPRARRESAPPVRSGGQVQE